MTNKIHHLTFAKSFLVKNVITGICPNTDTMHRVRLSRTSRNNQFPKSTFTLLQYNLSNQLSFEYQVRQSNQYELKAKNVNLNTD